VASAVFPEWLVPMAATLTQDRFTGPEWIFERKLDGIRLLAFKRGGTIRLLSRNRLPQNLPSIAAALAALPLRDLILDGELTSSHGMTYHVFDVMWVDGRQLTGLPLERRRALLANLPLKPPLARVGEVTAAMSAPVPRVGKASLRSGATLSTSIGGLRSGSR
jgi:bifunctional non-homologous end joining protein LigD